MAQLKLEQVNLIFIGATTIDIPFDIDVNWEVRNVVEQEVVNEVYRHIINNLRDNENNRHQTHKLLG